MNKFKLLFAIFTLAIGGQLFAFDAKHTDMLINEKYVNLASLPTTSSTTVSLIAAPTTIPEITSDITMKNSSTTAPDSACLSLYLGCVILEFGDSAELNKQLTKQYPFNKKLFKTELFGENSLHDELGHA